MVGKSIIGFIRGNMVDEAISELYISNYAWSRSRLEDKIEFMQYPNGIVEKSRTETVRLSSMISDGVMIAIDKVTRLERVMAFKRVPIETRYVLSASSNDYSASIVSEQLEEFYKEMNLRATLLQVKMEEKASRLKKRL